MFCNSNSLSLSSKTVNHARYAPFTINYLRMRYSDYCKLNAIFLEPYFNIEIIHCIQHVTKFIALI